MKAKYLFILFSVLHAVVCYEFSYGQTDTAKQSSDYSVPLQRLQLKLITSFVYFSLRGQIDLDSAARVVSEGEYLPYPLYYNEDFEAGQDNNIKRLLLEGAKYLFKSGVDKNDLDSALPYLLSAKRAADVTKDIYWQNAALALLGKFYIQKNDNEKSVNYFSQAVDLSRRANNQIVLALALANRGTYENYDNLQKEKDLNEALTLSQQQGNKIREIEMLTRIYEIYFVRGNYDTVNKQLLHVTDLEKSIGFKHLHYNYNVFAFLNFNLGDYSAMFANASAAVNLMESMNDYAFSNCFYGAMANNYSIFNDYQKAFEWYQKCISSEKINKLKRVWYAQVIVILDNMSGNGQPKEALDLLLKIKRDYPPILNVDKMNITDILASSYQSLNQPVAAKKYYEQLVDYIDSSINIPNEFSDISNCYLDLCSFYFESGNLNLAKQYLEKAKTYSDHTSLHDKGRIYWEQFKFDSTAGNYTEALKNYRKSRLIDDSLTDINKNKTIAELQIQFETKNKDKNIELLMQKGKIQEATLQQSNLIKNVTLAGIFFMLLITGLLYNQYRNKQISNKQINEKNTMLEQLVKDKDWLVKEIHHRVKNNLQTIVSLLESQAINLKNDALEAVQDSRNRIYTMSLIHQKLYLKDFQSSINMALFLPDLINNLRDSFDVKQRIRFVANIEPIVLDISQATPVGLILNEAIINAIKYAFPVEKKNNEINIYVGKGLGSDIEFEVSDNGIGLPENFEEKAESGLGIKLIRGLTTELHGHVYLSNNKGTKISIRFFPKSVTSLLN